MQNRFKSKVLWAALITQVLSILLLVGVFSQGEVDKWQTIAGLVLQLLTTLGVLNNPSDSENF